MQSEVNAPTRIEKAIKVICWSRALTYACMCDCVGITGSTKNCTQIFDLIDSLVWYRVPSLSYGSHISYIRLSITKTTTISLKYIPCAEIWLVNTDRGWNFVSVRDNNLLAQSTFHGHFDSSDSSSSANAAGATIATAASLMDRCIWHRSGR